MLPRGEKGHKILNCNRERRSDRAGLTCWGPLLLLPLHSRSLLLLAGLPSLPSVPHISWLTDFYYYRGMPTANKERGRTMPG